MTDHVDKSNLKKWLLASLAENESLRIEKHVSVCDACSRLADVMDAELQSDKWIEAALAPDDRSDIQEAALLGANLAVAKEIRLELTESGHKHLVRRRLKLKRLLGHGGMASVVQAEDQKLLRSVAIKFATIEKQGEQNIDLFTRKRRLAEFAERFEREATVTANFNSPNIASVYDYEPETPFLVIQCLEGESLRKRLESTNRFSFSEIVKLGINIAFALREAHEKLVIHRDVKPDNILLDRHGNAVLLDFGIAKRHGEESYTGHQSIGTPGYMSPEQVAGQQIDETTDWYALGATLLEMAVGKLPGEELFKMNGQKLGIWAKDLGVDLPPIFRRSILRMCCRSSRHRPQSAEEVIERLEALSIVIGESTESN